MWSSRGTWTEHWTDVGVCHTVLMITWHWTDHWRTENTAILRRLRLPRPSRSDMRNIASGLKDSLTTHKTRIMSSKAVIWLLHRKLNFEKCCKFPHFPSWKARFVAKSKVQVWSNNDCLLLDWNSVGKHLTQVVCDHQFDCEGCKGPCGAHLALKKTLASS